LPHYRLHPNLKLLHAKQLLQARLELATSAFLYSPFRGVN